MKKSASYLLLLLLLISVIINGYFFYELNFKSEITNKKIIKNLVGTWNDGPTELHVSEDGTIIMIRWASSESDPYIFLSQKGYLDGYSIIFNQGYSDLVDDNSVNNKFTSIDQIEYEDMSGNSFYTIIMYGENAFNLSSTNYNFVKNK